MFKWLKNKLFPKKEKKNWNKEKYVWSSRECPDCGQSLKERKPDWLTTVLYCGHCPYRAQFEEDINIPVRGPSEEYSEILAKELPEDNKIKLRYGDIFKMDEECCFPVISSSSEGRPKEILSTKIVFPDGSISEPMTIEDAIYKVYFGEKDV